MEESASPDPGRFTEERCGGPDAQIQELRGALERYEPADHVLPQVREEIRSQDQRKHLKRNHAAVRLSKVCLLVFWTCMNQHRSSTLQIFYLFIEQAILVQHFAHVNCMLILQ